MVVIRRRNGPLVAKSKTGQIRKQTALTASSGSAQSEMSGDDGGPEIDELFELLRGKLIFFFAAQRCHDPEELSDITLMRVFEKLDGREEEVSDLTRYTFGFAKNVLREYRRRKVIESIDDQKHQFAAKQNDGESEMRERKLACLDECMDRLPEQDRKLLLAYYQGKGEDRLKMAEQLNITREALTSRIFHLRQRVRKCMKARLEKM